MIDQYIFTFHPAIRKRYAIVMQNNDIRGQPNNNKHICNRPTVIFFKTKKQFYATIITRFKAVFTCNKTSLP